jgi:predicted small lipoprotein YifL
MKRILASVMALSVLSIGLVGCGEKTAVKKETKVETPGGTTTKTDTSTTKTTGDNPPK